MQTILKEIVLTNIINNNKTFYNYDLKHQNMKQLKNITEFHINLLLFTCIRIIDRVISVHNYTVICTFIYKFRYSKMQCKNIIKPS
jgi:ABC-type long-subunit fatty acid transport system fused permease/ATPase subunit